MKQGVRVLVLSETDEVRRIVGRALRSCDYVVVEAGSPRDALEADHCDLALIDVARRNEDLDAVARHLLATGTAGGALFFDGSSLEIAARSLRMLLRDVGEAVVRSRG
jgi:CheY-like chemotaxis protein